MMTDMLVAVAHAQTTTGGGKSFAEIVDGSVAPFGDLLISLLYLVAFLAFLYGVVKYLLAGNNEESRAKGRQFILWGIIGLVVLFGLWGIIKSLLSVLTSWQG